MLRPRPQLLLGELAGRNQGGVLGCDAPCFPGLERHASLTLSV